MQHYATTLRVLSEHSIRHPAWIRVTGQNHMGGLLRNTGAVRGYAAHHVGAECEILHGEGDEQVPMSEAQACFDAVGSRQKTFKVFAREEGWYHHCQIDNQSICSAYMWDWLEDVLQAGR